MTNHLQSTKLTYTMRNKQKKPPKIKQTRRTNCRAFMCKFLPKTRLPPPPPPKQHQNARFSSPIKQSTCANLILATATSSFQPSSPGFTSKAKNSPVNSSFESNFAAVPSLPAYGSLYDVSTEPQAQAPSIDGIQPLAVIPKLQRTVEDLNISQTKEQQAASITAVIKDSMQDQEKPRKKRMIIKSTEPEAIFDFTKFFYFSAEKEKAIPDFTKHTSVDFKNIPTIRFLSFLPLYDPTQRCLSKNNDSTRHNFTAQPSVSMPHKKAVDLPPLPSERIPALPMIEKQSQQFAETNSSQKRVTHTEPEEGIKSLEEITQMLAEFISEMRANRALPEQQYFQTSPPW